MRKTLLLTQLEVHHKDVSRRVEIHIQRSIDQVLKVKVHLMCSKSKHEVFKLKYMKVSSLVLPKVHFLFESLFSYFKSCLKFLSQVLTLKLLCSVVLNSFAWFLIHPTQCKVAQYT